MTPAATMRSGTALALALLVSACAAGGPRRAATDCRAQALPMTNETQVLDVLRVYTGADGVSHAESQPMAGQTSTYLGAVLRQFSFGSPSNVVMVSGPANFRIPAHAAPYREIFMLLSGSSSVELSDGTQHALHVGSLVLFEDVTGPGHGALFGPCGYVAIDLQFKPAPAK